MKIFIILRNNNYNYVILIILNKVSLLVSSTNQLFCNYISDQPGCHAIVRMREVYVKFMQKIWLLSELVL